MVLAQVPEGTVAGPVNEGLRLPDEVPAEPDPVGDPTEAPLDAPALPVEPEQGASVLPSLPAVPSIPGPNAAPTGGPDTPPPPALLSADEIVFEEDTDLVIAIGNVEIAREGRVVYADKVTYDRNTTVITATGNVRVFEASGEVLFTEYAELTDDLAAGFVEALGILMPDSSRMAGAEGERTEGTFVRLNKGVYTACSLCAEDPDAAPLWQLRARRVVHDKEEKEIRYRDVFLEMAGIPFFYMPYFSHPDPTVDRKSGFLPPVGGSNADLGSFFRSGYYFDIEPELDATLYVTYFFGDTGTESTQEQNSGTRVNPLFAGEVRRRFERGELILDGSITKSTAVERSGEVEPSRFRGHLFADGLYELSDAWRAGGQLRVASDFNFLREYFRFSGDNHLISRGYAEGFYGRDYALVEGYRFQSLITEDSGADPLVAPWAQYQAFGEPGQFLGGRWSFDLGVRGVTRDEGADSTRFTVAPGWQFRYIEETTGLVTEFNTGLRLDVYSFQDFDRDNVGVSEEGGEYRVVPDAQIILRYPWVRQSDSYEMLVEPITAFSIAPGRAEDSLFPVEDSLDLEFTDSNLFSRNRFTGTDRIEGGARLAYGVQTALYDYADSSIEVFLGQSLQFTEVDTLPSQSGVDKTFSDYVGHVDLQYTPWFNLFYGVRLDSDKWGPRLQYVQVSGGIPALTLSANFTSANEVSDLEQSGKGNEFITVGVSSALSEHWSGSISHNQQFSPDPGPRSAGFNLTYQDECLIFQATGSRDFTAVPGVESGFTFLFRLVFRNLGEITSPTLSPQSFGGGTANSSQ